MTAGGTPITALPAAGTPCHPAPQPATLGPEVLSCEELTGKSRFWRFVLFFGPLLKVLGSVGQRGCKETSPLPPAPPARWAVMVHPPGLQTSWYHLPHPPHESCRPEPGTSTANKICSKSLKLVVGWRQLLGLQPQKAPQETISSTPRPLYAVFSKTG